MGALTRTPTADHRRAVGSIKPRSVTDVILGLAGIDELIKWVRIPCKKYINTNSLSTNEPVQAEYGSQLVASSTGSIHHDMSHRRP